LSVNIVSITRLLRISPLLIVLLGYALFSWQIHFYVDANVLRAMPYLMSVILVCFAMMFNRSRFVAPILITLFVYGFIRSRLQSPLSQPDIMAMFIGLNILFCLQLVLSAVLPEKGLFSRAGLIFLGVLAAGDAALWFWGNSAYWVNVYSGLELQQQVFSETRYWHTGWLLLAHGVTALILMVVALWRRNASEYALLLTWLVGASVFYDFAQTDVSSVGFTALLLALFVIYQQSNYRVTYTDALTGIPGRRSLEDYLPTLGRHYAIAMLDVDHFKKFNDTYGHDVGDQVLKMVASRVNQVAGGGRAFRFGGEEFTVIFNRSDANASYVFLEAVRESIQHYQMTLRSDERDPKKRTGKQKRGSAPVKSKAVSVTISIGVANSAPGLQPKEVIKLADDNLYKAKQAGRNQTVRPKEPA